MSTHPSTHPNSERTAFAVRLLEAAVGAPGADEPLAGATVLTLLASLLAEGDLEPVAWMLDTAPGAGASFEVRSYSYGGEDEEHSVAGLEAGDALRTVLARVDQGADVVEALAVDPTGVTRRVIECRRGGEQRYLPPLAEYYEGEPDEVEEAVEAWTGFAPGGPVGPSADLDVPGRGLAGAGAGGLADPATLAGDQSSEVLELLRRTVRQALEEVTVEVDLGAVEGVVASAISHLLPAARGPAETPDGGAIDPAQLQRVLDALDRPPAPAGGVDEAFASRMVSALEEIRAEARRQSEEALAQSEAVSRQVEQVIEGLQGLESLAGPADPEGAGSGLGSPDRAGGPAALPAAAALALPAPADSAGTFAPGRSAEDIAGEIAEAVRAHLSAASSSDEAPARLAVVAERLLALTEVLEDRMRSSTRALEALAKDIAAGARMSDDHLGLLAHSVDGAIDRLGRRLESRIEELAIGPGRTLREHPAGRPAGVEQPHGEHEQPNGEHEQPHGEHHSANGTGPGR